MTAAEHCSSAARHLAKGEHEYVLAADDILAAFDAGMSYPQIAALLNRSAQWVRELARWRRTGLESPDAHDPLPTPFAGQYDQRMDSAARQAVRERPEVIVEALRANPEVIAVALKDEHTRASVLASPEGIATTLAMHRELTAREPRESREEPMRSPAFASAFWHAVGAVQAAWVELERVGVQGLDAQPETRLAAERLITQAHSVGRAVVDHVVENIEEV